MIKVITAAPYNPVSLVEAKLWLREDGADQNNVITRLIKAMANYAEHLTGRAFVQRTLELDMDDWTNAWHEDYGACVMFPWAPLVGVDSIAYTDTARAAQTLAGTVYDVDTVSTPGMLRLAYGQSWPGLGYGFNRVRIQYRAGYAPVGSPADEAAYQAGIPDELKTWLHARIATLYENREQLMASNNIEIPRHFADGLLDSLIVGDRLF